MQPDRRRPKYTKLYRGDIFTLGEADAMGLCVNAYETNMVVSAFFLGIKDNPDLVRGNHIFTCEHDTWAFTCFGWKVIGHVELTVEEWPEPVRVGLPQGPIVYSSIPSPSGSALSVESRRAHGFDPEHPEKYPLSCDLTLNKSALVPYHLARIVLAKDPLVVRNPKFAGLEHGLPPGFLKYCEENEQHWQEVKARVAAILDLKLSYLEYWRRFVAPPL
jgi:hypothetical protein